MWNLKKKFSNKGSALKSNKHASKHQQTTRLTHGSNVMFQFWYVRPYVSPVLYLLYNALSVLCGVCIVMCYVEFKKKSFPTRGVPWKAINIQANISKQDWHTSATWRNTQKKETRIRITLRPVTTGLTHVSNIIKHATRIRISVTVITELLKIVAMVKMLQHSWFWSWYNTLARSSSGRIA